MDQKAIAYGILRALVIVAGTLVLCAFLFAIRSILLYIAISAVIALVGRPMVFFFRRRLRLPNQLAVILALLVIFSTLLGIIALFIPIIYQQSENFNRIDFEQLRLNLNVLNAQIRDYLGLEQAGLIESFHLQKILEFFDFTSIPLFMSSLLSKMGTILVGLLSVVFISFYFLKDSNLLLNSFLAFSKNGNEERFKRIFDKIKNLLSRYFIGIALQLFVLFVLYTILLLVFEVQNPFAVAFICAFLNIVPYIGPVVAGVLMVFFVGSTHISGDFSTEILPNILYVLTGYLLVQLIDNIINQPLIFGQSVKSHPLEIFLIILIAGITFGIFGMIIAVPCYTAIKVVAKEVLSKYKVVKYLTKGL